jgi:hypothetical protein
MSLLVVMLFGLAAQWVSGQGVVDDYVKAFLDNVQVEGLSASVGPSVPITADTNKAEVVSRFLKSAFTLDLQAQNVTAMPVSDETTSQVAQLVDAALAVAQIDWSYNGLEATTYALAMKDTFQAGDSEAVIEPVTGTFTINPTTTTSKHHPQDGPFLYSAAFANGFKQIVATFDGEVKCQRGDTLTHTCKVLDACHDSRSLCSCKHTSRVECTTGPKCFAELAFVGYCGNPTITFDDMDFEYKVSPRSAIYHKAYVALEKDCACSPPK